MFIFFQLWNEMIFAALDIFSRAKTGVAFSMNQGS